MYSFSFSLPTRLHFGKGAISHLSELKANGDKVLLVYGGGSIKRNGIYDAAMKALQEAGIHVSELAGVQPNPKIDSVREGVKICREQGIESVLAIGGGSAIDCSKVIAAGAKYNGDPWDLVIHPEKIQDALPIYCVLTLSATGTEMDQFAVISDMTKNEKWGTASEYIRPTMSILDPTYTFTVSKKQTAAGTADMMSHTFENYFSFEEGAEVQKQFGETLLRVIIKYGPVAYNQPDNYEARANLMWAGTNAINGITAVGNAPAWCVHPMEHELSAFYDITHGQGLAILTPRWMEHVLSDKTAPIFARYGRNVWGLTGDDDMAVSKEAIEKTKKFLFEDLQIPGTLREVGITEQTHFEKMAEKAAAGSVGCFVPLSKEDIVEIFKAAF